MDMFDLEKDLPDELMSSGSWGDQLVGGSKPPAQGPGPGASINGEDGIQRINQPNHQLQVCIIFR